MLLKIVTLATLVHARLALTAQFAANQTAAHQAATLAVSMIVNFGNISTGAEYSVNGEESISIDPDGRWA